MSDEPSLGQGRSRCPRSRPPRRSSRARSASSAGRSTRSITATSPSRRRCASGWALSGCCSSRRACRRIGRWRPARPPRTATRWSGSRSPTTRRSRSAASSSIARGRPTRSTPWRCWPAELRATGREPNLWFIASAEAIRGLPTWREPERLLGMTRFAVVPRAGAEPLDEAWLTARLPAAAGRLVLLDGPLMLVSGTVIRARAAVGRSLRYLVPEAVARYIGDHRLVPSGGHAVARAHAPTRPGDASTVTDPATSTPRADGLPARGSRAPSDERVPLEVARRIVEAAEDKKAADIVLLELGELTTVADYFVICSGGSERQIDAIADGVLDALRTDGVRPIGREGDARIALGAARLRRRSSSTCSPRPSATSTSSSGTGARRRRSSASSKWCVAGLPRGVEYGQRRYLGVIPAQGTRPYRSGQVVDRTATPSPREPRRDVAPPRALPRLQPEAHHHALRHDVPTA